MVVRLPVSRWEVTVRPPGGVEDLLLMQSLDAGTDLALALVARLAERVGDAPDGWETLPVPDLEALLLHIRKAVFGDRLRAETRCVTPACGARIDVDFPIDAYLAHHTPRLPRHVAPDESGQEGAGWYRFIGGPEGAGEVRFRLPAVADRLAVAHSRHPADDLARRCMRPADLPAAVRRRVVRAMSSLAPSLSHELDGRCPECGAALDFYLDVQEFTLRELRDQARHVLDDVHLIAATYHWSEAEILALPRARRMHYAERIRQASGQED